MDKIEVKVLNPDVLNEAERMMVCAARLTQSGHKIKDMNDFMALYNRSYSQGTLDTMARLPHPTIQKFAVINVAIVGASRRFLAQITRHQNEVKFMSASLQYSTYGTDADFVVPYNILTRGKNIQDSYLDSCKRAMDKYTKLNLKKVDNDSCGYVAPQSLRNILIISATPYQWKHMISQRTCRRNTPETRYVMLKVWEELYKLSPALFNSNVCGPFCMKDGVCKEGKFGCCKPLKGIHQPTTIIAKDFPKLVK